MASTQEALQVADFAAAPSPGALVWDATPGGDDQLSVEFYRDHMRGEGDRIKIKLRGDPSTVVDEPVRERHTVRFASLWKAYKEGRAMESEGTPLGEVVWLDPDTTAQLRLLQIHTIEQLAGISDGAVEQAGVFALAGFRDAAQRHLERTRRASGYDALERENRILADRIAALEAESQRDAKPAQGRAPQRKG